MNTDDRNFRSSYYEKVGCFSVEEKKSLNKLLLDDVRNLNKLKQFCLSYKVPATQRSLLWSLIMEIMPLHKTSTEYCQIQQRQVYEDLFRAVTVMRYIGTSTSKEEIMLSMWQLETNRLLHPGAHPDVDDNHFIEIVRVLLKVFDNDVETYWIAKEFYSYTREIKKDCTKLKELTKTLLKREDIALFHHLEKLGVFVADCHLIDYWFTTCFASIISESVLVKVWDKVCGGSRKIVVFLFLELVKDTRQVILCCNSQSELKTIIETVKDQDGVIINKAINTWHSNNSHSEIEYTH